jgi:hypothetical protein
MIFDRSSRRHIDVAVAGSYPTSNDSPFLEPVPQRYFTGTTSE